MFYLYIKYEVPKRYLIIEALSWESAEIIFKKFKLQRFFKFPTCYTLIESILQDHGLKKLSKNFAVYRLDESDDLK